MHGGNNKVPEVGKTALDLGGNPSINQPVRAWGFSAFPGQKSPLFSHKCLAPKADPQMTDGPGYRKEPADRRSQSAGIVWKESETVYFFPLFLLWAGFGRPKTHIMWVKR